MKKDTPVAEMKDLSSTSFGYLIAFLLPGLAALYALSFWFSQIGSLLQPVLKADATVGPSIVLLLMAVGIGLCVSAVRHYLFERLLCARYKLPKDMFSELYKDGRLAAFKEVVDAHYRYHQFYGGCGVALLILFVGWIRNHLTCEAYVATLAFVAFEVMLTASARDAFIRYVERGCTIVSVEKGRAETTSKPERDSSK